MQALTHNLGQSVLTFNEEGIPVLKIVAGALYPAAAYLEAIKPPADDPNARLHRQQIKSPALAAKAINQKTPGGTQDRDIMKS